MAARAPRRALYSLTLVVVALYATVALAAAFEHHDLSCELKTPQHCVACVSSAASADRIPVVAFGCAQLGDAGRPILSEARAESLLLCADRPGRSPPSIAPRVS